MTPSCRPISLISPLWCLNWKDELRAITGRLVIRPSVLSISVDMPSLKYSLSGSPLRFTNGSTAMPGFGSNWCGDRTVAVLSNQLIPVSLSHRRAPGKVNNVAITSTATTNSIRADRTPPHLPRGGSAVSVEGRSSASGSTGGTRRKPSFGMVSIICDSLALSPSALRSSAIHFVRVSSETSPPGQTESNSSLRDTGAPPDAARCSNTDIDLGFRCTDTPSRSTTRRRGLTTQLPNRKSVPKIMFPVCPACYSHFAYIQQHLFKH